MFHKYALTLLLGAVTLAPITACHSPTKGVTNYFGTYTTMVSASADHTIAAARDVAREMNLTEITYKATPAEGELIAQNSTDKTFEIRTAKEGDRVCQLSVRVGTGDKELSYAIIEKIKMKL